MSKYGIYILLLVFYANQGVAQLPIKVAEITFKIAALGGEEVFYYGFAEGDQIDFSFEEINGKDLKEIEIVAYPSSSKFLEFKSSKIENKILHIQRTGIYKFRFSNSSLGARVCKVKIQRIPVSDKTKDFNSSVYWKTVFDTTFAIAGEKSIIKNDTIIHNLTDQVAKVHSRTNLNRNRTTLSFTLPDNTVVWSYYIGVEQASQQAFESATKQLSVLAAPIVMKIPGYGPMAALTLGGVSYLSTIQKGEDIDFYIVDDNNVKLFQAKEKFDFIKRGKIINDFSRMLSPLNGTFHVCLSNDNAIVGVTVAVKITAIVVTQKEDLEPIKKIKITSQKVPYLMN